MVLRESKEGQDRGQIQSGNELLFNLCRSPSQPRAGGSAAGWAVPGWGRAPIHRCPAQGGFPAPSGLHPTAAKVLVRHPSSFPGIKEPNESGGIPRSEAKAFGRVSPPGPACGGASPPDLEPWLLPGKPGVKVAALRGKIRAPGGTGRLLQQEFPMELRAFPREKNRNSQPPRPDSPLQPELSTHPERQFQHLKEKKEEKSDLFWFQVILSCSKQSKPCSGFSWVNSERWAQGTSLMPRGWGFVGEGRAADGVAQSNSCPGPDWPRTNPLAGSGFVPSHGQCPVCPCGQCQAGDRHTQHDFMLLP
ncbi:uncharacterized protein LOC135412631 [Pseudopipra pipra]|uniref:uncharacterized protein LOC135412631 n=1 Tax=Pseudopipra pipra TaxID=415032 RepID=UPI0031388FFF